MPARLTIESVKTQSAFVLFDAQGRSLTFQNGRVTLDGDKPVAIPKVDEGRWQACRDRFVFVGHPWQDRKPATVLVLGDGTPATYKLTRKQDGHVLGAWADGAVLSLVISDAFHVVHGIAVAEAVLKGAAPVRSAVRKVTQLDRHIGKGAELSLQSIMRRGDEVFAIASAGHRQHALLALDSKAMTFAARVLVRAKADQAIFSASGEHAVFYERDKTATIIGLDGAKLATVTPKAPKGAYLAGAAPQKLVFGVDDSTIVITTSAWPAGPGVIPLARVPRTLPIADLPVAEAQRCSPEPIAYAGATLPAAFGAVVGWALNADPKKAKPIASHAIVTDRIVNFFAIGKDRRLRFLFNFDLAAITRVEIDKQVVTIETPSGRTTLHATPTFAAALKRATKKRVT